jgi:putative phage-type endonuclease
METKVWLPDTVKVFNVEQRSDEWRFLRGNYRTPITGKVPEDWIPFMTPFRFTASEIFCLTGENRYKSRDKYFKEALGIIPRTFTGNTHTQRGQRLEPAIREMYEAKTNTKVEEVGFVVPRWCPFIGVSPDGLTDEGSIEIKSPVRVWKELIDEGVVKGEHYAQMQMAMIICDRPWCDYIVYSELDNQYVQKRVPRDQPYWDETLYPCILEAIDEGKKHVIGEICKELEDVTL